jgi:hypothetical protein
VAKDDEVVSNLFGIAGGRVKKCSCRYAYDVNIKKIKSTSRLQRTKVIHSDDSAEVKS